MVVNGRNLSSQPSNTRTHATENAENENKNTAMENASPIGAAGGRGSKVVHVESGWTSVEIVRWRVKSFPFVGSFFFFGF